MAKDINFRIKLNVDGKDQVVTASTNVKDLANQLGIARDRSQEFKSALQSFANISMGLQGLSNAIQGLASQMQEYTQAYAAQQQAETQLQQVMRNTMGATEAEVLAIKDLCAAQQQLGVVGDEVQLAGAKEIAMHVKNMGTIEALIPLMNDLAVKQDGYNVSASTAASVGAMLGKAMEGNFTALQRAGIVLSEAQKKIMETGSESERAALLVEVLGQKVGGMNQEMANTDAGRMQQMANTIGDLKERIGEMIGAWAPAIQMAAQFGLALNGIIMLGGGLKTLILAFGSLSKAVGLSALNNKLAASSAALLNRTLVAMGVTSKATAVSVNALKWAIKGLELATVVGAIIVAITSAIEHLGKSSEEAADSFDELASAADERNRVAGETKVVLDEEIAKLRDLIKTNGDASAEVEHLNRTYGNIFGTHKTATEWYNTLIAKSKDYCMQLGYQAEIQRLAAVAAEKAVAVDDLNARINNLFTSGKAYTKRVTTSRDANGEEWETVTYQETAEVKALREQRNEALRLSREASRQMEHAQNRLKQVSSRLGTTVVQDKNLPTTAPTTSHTAHGGGGRTGGHHTSVTQDVLREILDPRTRADYENNIKFYDEAINKTAKTDVKALQALGAKKAAAQAQINEIDRIIKSGDVRATGILTQEPKLPTITPQEEKLAFMSGDEFMRQYYQRLQDQANQYKADFDMGIIDEDTLRKKIDQINKWLEGWGLKPIKLDISTDGIPEKLKAAMDGVNQMGQSLSNLGSALKVPELNVAGTIAQAIATLTMAYGTASAQSASMGPWAWLGFSAVGLAQLAAVISSVKNLNKFADGCIAYGPTLGLFGEYAGASHNPEVVAPLDKLRSMIQPAGYAGDVRFRVEGRELVGVLANETRTSRKAGGRTHIKI